ncbi:MAG: hypothetical protein MR872_06775 [Clostridium sp.]|nr:hypothetical protein [Clostridium sp.]
MGSFAVIDTETNWEDEVMSIGCCIADADTFGVISAKYHVLIPECEIGGMYYDALFPDTPVQPMLCSGMRLLAIFSHGSLGMMSGTFSLTMRGLTAVIFRSWQC